MAILTGTIADKQWYETQSDTAIAQAIAEQSPKQTDQAIRALNQAYRAAAGPNFGLDPVNMIPVNPVGELLNESYKAIVGGRTPLTEAEILRVVSWIRANPA